MTTREFYAAVIDITTTMEATDNDMTFGPNEAHPAELTAKARELIAALDAKNEKRKNTETKEQKEAAARRELVKNFFLSHPDIPFTRDVVADELWISAGQVSAWAKTLIADGVIIKAEAKVGKTKKVVYIHTTTEK